MMPLKSIKSLKFPDIIFHIWGEKIKSCLKTLVYGTQKQNFFKNLQTIKLHFKNFIKFIN